MISCGLLQMTPFSKQSSVHRSPLPKATLTKTNIDLATKFIVFLAVTAIILKWGAAMFSANTTQLVESYDGTLRPETIQIQGKSIIYYALHGSAILAFILAGIIAFNKNYKKIGVGLWFFIGLQIINIIWMVIDTLSGRYLNLWSMLGHKGPLVWLLAFGLFAGLHKSVWKFMSPILEVLCYISAFVLLIKLFSMYSSVRLLGQTGPLKLLILLWWLTAIVFLEPNKSRGWRRYLIYLPYVVLILAALWLGARSWLLLTIILLPLKYIVLSQSMPKNQKSFNKSYKEISLSVVVILIILMSYAFLRPDSLRDSADGFLGRLFDDSRSGQYVAFFDVVSPYALILGKGPNATWFWTGRGEYKHFDNSYLLALFRGGMPLLVCYIGLVIVPGYKLYFRKPVGFNYVVSIIIILWSLMLAGLSTFNAPFLTLNNFIVYLVVGRCYKALEKSEL